MVGTGDVRWVVNGKNIDVTPALRSYAEKRMGKVLKHFDPERNPITVEVMLGVERDTHTAEVTLKVGRLLVRGEARTHDLYASIDEATDRVGRRIRKYKTRLKSRTVDSPKLAQAVAHAAAENEVARTAAEAEAEGEAVEMEEANALPRVVRTKRFALKPMSVEEAALQMELLGHDFFVFANAGTEQVNVLYRRKDGQLGLIEPELA